MSEVDLFWYHLFYFCWVIFFLNSPPGCYSFFCINKVKSKLFCIIKNGNILIQTNVQLLFICMYKHKNLITQTNIEKKRKFTYFINITSNNYRNSFKK